MMVMTRDTVFLKMGVRSRKPITSEQGSKRSEAVWRKGTPSRIKREAM